MQSQAHNRTGAQCWNVSSVSCNFLSVLCLQWDATRPKQDPPHIPTGKRCVVQHNARVPAAIALKEASPTRQQSATARSPPQSACMA